MVPNMNLEAALFICFTVVALYGVLRITRSVSPPLSYKKKNLLTGPDHDFFQLLKEALPECHIFPRLAMKDLIQPTGDWRSRKAGAARIARAHIGYAVFDEEMQLISVVELDVRSHRVKKQRSRDKYFATANIPVARFRANSMPSIIAIRKQVFRKLSQRGPHRLGEEQTLAYMKTPVPDMPEAFVVGNIRRANK
jgi:hypothetical protein